MTVPHKLAVPHETSARSCQESVQEKHKRHLFLATMSFYFLSPCFGSFLEVGYKNIDWAKCLCSISMLLVWLTTLI